MTFESPWAVLGVEPNADETEVRAAYARQLKHVNPEDSPEAFKRLRWAYEQATRILARRAIETDDVESDHLHQQRDMRALEASASLSQRPLDENAPTPGGEIDTHAQLRRQLLAALHSDADPEALRRHLDAVLRAPAMQRIDIFDDTSRWLVELIFATQPRSYALVAPIIDHFGWKYAPEQLNEWQGPRAMLDLRDFLRSEARVEEFVKRLDDPRHELHRAFALTRPTPTPLPDQPALQQLWALRHINLVERFLAQVERRHRGLLSRLDTRTVEWWKRQFRNESLAHTIMRNARPIALGLSVIAAVFAAAQLGAG